MLHTKLPFSDDCHMLNLECNDPPVLHTTTSLFLCVLC